VRTPYLGDTLVWTFRDDAERRRYSSLRKSSVEFAFRYLFIPLAFLMFIAVLGGLARELLMVIGALFLLYVVMQLLSGRPKLVALELRLHPKKFMVAERYDRPNWFRRMTVAVHPSAVVTSLIWVSGGCHVEFRGGMLRERPLTLPMGMFSTQDAIDALYRWAEEHKITIEGVQPIPGAYARPIEERRGR
jgi:hypothetical protein